VQQHRREPKHKIRTPEEIQVAEIRRKQKERERNRKVRERLKAAPNITSASRNVLESDPIYPHGKVKAKTLKGIDGYLLALQYENPASLGKALGALRGEIYWLPPENDRALIWLPADIMHKLPHEFSDRLTYLAQFDVAETKRPCDRCKKQDVLYATGKYGYPVRFLCFKCSRLASTASEKAVAAREEAEKLKNVLPMFRPIRKLQKPTGTLPKAA
jgi:hypothetical protein